MIWNSTHTVPTFQRGSGMGHEPEMNVMALLSGAAKRPTAGIADGAKGELLCR
jgi:hypothetical protein